MPVCTCCQLNNIHHPPDPVSNFRLHSCILNSEFDILKMMNPFHPQYHYNPLPSKTEPLCVSGFSHNRQSQDYIRLCCYTMCRIISVYDVRKFSCRRINLIWLCTIYPFYAHKLPPGIYCLALNNLRLVEAIRALSSNYYSSSHKLRQALPALINRHIEKFYFIAIKKRNILYSCRLVWRVSSSAKVYLLRPRLVTAVA